MKIIFLIMMFIFNANAFGNSFSNIDSKQLQNNSDLNECAGLFGIYSISNSYENDYFAYLNIAPDGFLNFEIGIVDNYQPILRQSVKYACINGNSISFEFNDDYDNKSVGVLKKIDSQYIAEFEVIEENNENIEERNNQRNYDRYELQKIDK